MICCEQLWTNRSKINSVDRSGFFGCFSQTQRNEQYHFCHRVRNCVRTGCLSGRQSLVYVGLMIFTCGSAIATEPQRLTRDGALKLSPVFTHKGAGVIFSMHREPNQVSLMQMRLSDANQERLDTSLVAHQFDADVTADGRYLCFVLTYTSPQSILVIRDLKDGPETRFIPQEARGTVRSPKISPDQRSVVLTLSDPGGQQIATVDMKGASLRRLTQTVGTNAWPAISPDGRHIAFSSSRDGNFQIYIMNLDGSGVRQLTNHPLRNIRPTWSPDGQRIAFTSARDGNLEIYVVRSDGTNLQRLTDHPERDDFPAWHPDGKRLLIVSEREGDSDLYIIESDSEDVGQ